jgi:hypothetical protein
MLGNKQRGGHTYSLQWLFDRTYWMALSGPRVGDDQLRAAAIALTIRRSRSGHLATMARKAIRPFYCLRAAQVARSGKGMGGSGDVAVRFLLDAFTQQEQFDLCHGCNQSLHKILQ